ncbi:MAG: hypothetical protein ACRDH2_04620 [Anaerolineales bacterium]
MYGFTTLNWAVLNGQVTTAALLLARGADVNILTWGKTHCVERSTRASMK